MRQGARRRRLLLACSVSLGVALAVAPAAPGQEAEHDAAGHLEHGEEPEHRHALSLSGGAATHTERSETGYALGLSYAYFLSEKWAIGPKLEYADSELERDFVVLAGVAYEAAERLELGAGVGVEAARRTELHEGGEPETEDETEAVLRLTTLYAFPLGSRTYLSPEFNADITTSRVTYVYGLAFTVGF